MTQPGNNHRVDHWPTRILLGLSLTMTFMIPSSVSASVLPSATFAVNLVGQEEFGTIKGRLVWGGDTIPAPKILEPLGNASKDPNVCSKSAAIIQRALVVDPKTKGVSYAFAYLVKPKGTNPAAVKALIANAPKVELDQKNCEFVPYVLPMHTEQTLLIKSTDPIINHNVRMSAFRNPGKNQTLGPGGTLELKLEPERLPIEMACDIHPWMKANVMVFDHPFFATTSADGSFVIKGVPPGTQNLIVWQKSVGFATPGTGRGMPVEVKAGEVTDVGEIKLDASKAQY